MDQKPQLRWYQGLVREFGAKLLPRVSHKSARKLKKMV